MIDLTCVRRRLFLWLSFVPLALAVSGCQTVSYYKQAIQGQYRILTNRRSIQDLVEDPKAPAILKERLQLVLQLREFAGQQLKLPVNTHYLQYADVHRRYVVWNVHAAPEFSLEPKTWHYPIVGQLKYRGFFSKKDAQSYARQLGAKGFDVYVEGVEAYSTLGWFKDPVLNTFINNDESDLAEIVFHELAHQQLFVGGDTDFDEAFATAVAEEGVRRWLRSRGDAPAYESYLTGLKRNDEFARLIIAVRRQLQTLYADPTARTDHPARSTLFQAAVEKRQAKEAVITDLRREYEQLKIRWGGYTGYDRWFARPLNNAQLNTVATYYDLVPAFNGLLQENGNDLVAFYQAVVRLAKLPKKERHGQLERFADRQ